MRTTYVTACNMAYGAQNLALYRSLERHATGDWRMAWVVLDRDEYVQLRAWQQDTQRTPRLLLCDGSYIMARNEGLTNALAKREGGPWFWTWAAQATALFTDGWPDDVTVYMDTDCYFFADPAPAIAEVEAAGADVGVVSHRFPPHRAEMWQRANWNVGFNVFRPTRRARALAAWWASMVRSQCDVHMPADDYLGIPAGRAGDQDSLDAWPRLAKVHEIRHPGVGLAPYNADAYEIAPGARIVRAPTPSDTLYAAAGDSDAVIYYHYHESRFRLDGTLERDTRYPIPPDVRAHLYEPYYAAVQAAAQEFARG